MNPENSHIQTLLNYCQERGELIFLESQKKDHPASTASFLAAEPRSWIKSNGKEIRIFRDGKVSVFTGKNVWEELQRFRNETNGWLFGYFGYDVKNDIEDLISGNKNLNSIPDLFFMEPGVLLRISANGEEEVLIGELPEVAKKADFDRSFRIHENHKIPKEEYLKKVEKAQFQISEGEYYEVNLSHPLTFSFEGSELGLYQRMKEIGPVPFASYLSVDGIHICCSSPERFLSRQNDRVWSQPIKGTSSRNGENDTHSISALQSSEKDRAENLMIVDLVRNDLNRIAEKGTVKVKDLFEIQSFETVHQMVSTVECKVDPQKDSVEIIKACFPMGSMTGAPKIAAMKAIEELEDYKRGIYSGAIGYFKPDGDFDFNVVIRTAIIENGSLVYPVGGAITSDSVPEDEWEETLVKARALTDLLK